MKDVAKAAGVTTAAVSYAISGKRPISDETRKRVEAAIKELGYTPNMAARTLSSAGRSSKLIGVVVKRFTDICLFIRVQFVKLFQQR